jgi:small-conductance mechanosensitive channel
MPRTPSQVDQAALYEAALEGLELQKQRLEEQIRLVRSLIGGKKPRATAPAPSATEVTANSAAKKAGRKPRRKRNLSPEARKRIAEAQKKRWAAFRKDTDA